MADSYKILNQSQPGATLTDLYTVPTSHSAVIACLVVCNIASSAKSFRVSVAASGAADATSQYLYRDTNLPANDSMELLKGMTLAAGDKVRVYASDGNVNFTLFGDDVT